MKRPTLRRDLWIAFIILASIVVIISAWRAWRMREWLENDSRARMRQEALYLEPILGDTVQYLNHIMRLVADQISDLASPSPEAIAHILAESRAAVEKDSQALFSWSLFDFIDPHGHVIAASRQGVINTTLVVTPKQRQWLDYTDSQPFTLFFDPPATGFMSGERVIPVAMGVRNTNGVFLGTLSMGLPVRALQHVIDRSLIFDDSSFILLSTDGGMVAASAEYQDTPPVVPAMPVSSDPLDTPLARYYQHHILTLPPLHIWLGTTHQGLSHRYMSALLPRLESMVYLAIICSILLYFFRRYIIKPVEQLSRVAKSLSQGVVGQPIPHSSIEEYHVLEQQLQHVQGFIGALQVDYSDSKRLAKDTGELAAGLGSEAAFPAQQALAELDYLTRNIALADPHNPLVRKWKSIGHYLLQLQEIITDLVMLNNQGPPRLAMQSSRIKLAHSVDEVLLLLQPLVEYQSLTIAYRNEAEGVSVYADPTRFKQMLTSIIRNAIAFAPAQSSIALAIKRHEGGRVTITVTDARFMAASSKVAPPHPFYTIPPTLVLYSTKRMQLTLAKKLAQWHGYRLSSKRRATEFIAELEIPGS